jgi:NAD(P) transhydrogenase subunit alpha
MVIGVPRETAAGERRVALVPETVGKLVKSGLTVTVERGAGSAASFPDAAYEEAGATLASDAAGVFGKADLIVKVQRPSEAELNLTHPGQTIVALLSPLGDPASVEAYASRKLNALSMDAIPRITRAQAMDVLSSQANCCRVSFQCSRQPRERSRRRRS